MQTQNKPVTDLFMHWGFQKIKPPKFQQNRHMKVVSLLALRTG